ncbi:MAG TPA: GNAT family N-acetyltransferase [Solirubrobacteraceae bacterium]
MVLAVAWEHGAANWEIIRSVHVVVTRDAPEFAARAGSFLQARMELNLLSTILGDVLSGHYQEDTPLFAYAISGSEEVVAVAVRTPPRFMLASDVDRHAAEVLLDVWLDQDPELPGVAGTPATTRAIGGVWSERKAGTTRPTMRMALHDLEAVHDPPAPAAGRLREPAPDERPLVIRWAEEFAREVGAPVMPAASVIDARLADGLLLVWDNGEPVSLVGLNHPVAGAVRIGPVFTPPEHRRHGYAGTAVAEASRLALDRGARTCILYTDLLNPTSNKIYAEVGYRRVAEWEELIFEPAETSRGDDRSPDGAAAFT